MCIFIPLLVGAICGLLGYLLGKLLGGNSDMKVDYENQLTKNQKLQSDFDANQIKLKSLSAELDNCKKGDTNKTHHIKEETDHLHAEIINLKEKNTDLTSANSNLSTELEACKSSKSSTGDAALGLAAGTGLGIASTSSDKTDALEKENSSLKNRIAELEKANSGASGVILFDAEAAKSVMGKKIVEDDLKIVEGIGPKIEELYHNFGIKTWKQLSETSVEKSMEVLQSGGDRFAMHKPGSWSKQALLAYEGKWQELKDWQDQLDGGV